MPIIVGKTRKHADLTDVSTPHLPPDISQASTFNWSSASSTFAGVITSTKIGVATSTIYGDGTNISGIAAGAAVTGGTIGGGTINPTYAYNFTNTTSTFIGAKIGTTTSSIYGDASNLTNTPAGAYARAVTKVVAASNSKDTTNADYICDGTADEVEINAALRASTFVVNTSTMGGVVYLMEGTYTTSSSIAIPASNMTLAGAGLGTHINALGNYNAILVSGKNNVIIDSVFISGTGYNVGWQGYSIGVYLLNTNNCIVQNSFIENFCNCNVNCYPGSRNKIIRNHFQGPGVYGAVWIYTDSDNVGRCVVSNNTILGPGYAGGYGIYVSADSAGKRGNNVISNNTVDSVTGNGIHVKYSSENIVCANTVISSSLTGIAVDTTTNDNLIIGNFLRGNATNITDSGGRTTIMSNVEV